MTPDESNTWKPGLPGWSTDIIQFYHDVAEEIPAGGVCVELGVWCGRSLTYLAHRLRSLGKQCELWGIDAWPNDYGFGGHDDRMAAAGGVYASSLTDMLKYAPEYFRDINLVRCDSARGARLFEPSSVDFCFVDAMHDFVHVKADLAAWTPKLKAGGILAGHDYTSDYPGVESAIGEAFGPRDGGIVKNPVGVVWRVNL